MLRKLIPAEPIEQAILGLLRLLLSRKPDLERDVRAAVGRIARREADPEHEMDMLVKERDAARRKIAFALETLDESGKDAASELIHRLQARIRALDAEIAQRSKARTLPADTDETVRRAMTVLSKLEQDMDALPRAALRRFVAVFVSRAVVDLETRLVELELRLPDWVVALPESMCLDTKIAWKPCNEAHGGTGAILLSPKLLWVPELQCFGAFDFGAAA